MATDLEKLVVQLSADIRGYQREIAKAQGITNRQARAIETRFRTMNRNLDGIGRSAARSLIAPLSSVAAALTVREVIQYADAWKRAGNALRVSGVPAGELSAVMDRLFNIAQRSGAALEPTVQLFSRLTQSANELGASREQLFQFSEGVGAALRVAGTSSAQASGALLQLSQALGGGIVRAEEFNSILEGARPIAQAVANGLDEAGGSVARLRQLVIDGEVSSREFFTAFLEGSVELRAQANAAATTFDQAFTRISNAFTRYIGQTDETLGASDRLIQGLNALADNFDGVADAAILLAGALVSGLIGRGIAQFIVKMGTAAAAVKALVLAMRSAQVGGFAAALGGVGAAAGPLGAAIGVAAGAAVYFATQASEAEQRTERLKNELRSMGLISDDATVAINRTGEALENLAPEATRQKLADINAELERMRGGRALGQLTDPRDEERLGTIIDHLRSIRQEGLTLLRGGEPVDAELDAVSRELEDIAVKLRDGQIEADEATRRLNNVAEVQVSEEVDELIASLRTAIEYMAGLEALAEQTADAAGRAASALSGVRQAQDESMRALDEEQRRTREFLQERERLSQRSDREENIERLTEEIIREAEEKGIMLTRAAALAQAIREVDQELGEKSSKRENAYERETQKIQEQIAVLQAEAAVRGQGTLAIERARTEQELLNAAKEAGIELSAEERASITALAEAYAQAQAAMEFQGAVESAQRRTQELQNEATAMGLTAAEAERLRVAQELLNAAQEAGIAVGQRFTTVQELMAANSGELSTEVAQQRAQILGLADSAAQATQNLETMRTAQENLTERLDLVRDVSKDMLSGFLSDLKEGKSLTEALVNALNRLADRLLDFALDNLVENLFGPRGTTQGGLLGGIFGGTATGGVAPTIQLAQPAVVPVAPITSRDRPLPPAIAGTAPVFAEFADSLRAAGRNLLEFSPAVIGASDAVQATTGRFDALLGLIRRGEGTAASGFSTTLGYGRFLGGAQPDLTRMTLDQVREIQTQMLRNPANAFNASPAGAFQITRRTLDSLREQMGLTGQELFTPELQTRLAEQLIQNRLDQAQRLGISPIQNLRSEFEGLRSIDTSQIQSALDQAGQQITSSTQQLSGGLQTAASSVTQAAGQFTPQFTGSLTSLATTMQSSVGQFTPQFTGSLLQLLQSIQTATPSFSGLNLGQVASLSGFAGLFQHGGRIGSGKWGIVGERGPEIVTGPANIVPPRLLPPHERQRRSGSSFVQHNNFVVHGPIDRRSENQIASRVADSGRRAVRIM